MSTEGTTKPPRYEADDVKAAARGRELELLEVCAGIPRDSLDGKPCSCPKCGGPNDRARMFDSTTGAFLCNKCGKFTDWIAVIKWKNDCDFPTAIRSAAELLGVPPKEGEAKPATPEEILAAVARAKKVKPESLQHFGGVVENGAVVFPTWDAKGNPQLLFRIWPGSGKPSKGLFDSKRKKGNEDKFAGVFLPVVDGKPVLPQPGDSVLLFEGVKDPAAAFEMGYQAVGLNTCRMSKKFAALFRDVDVITCADRDTAGDEGTQHTSRILFRKARSVKNAIWPVEIKPKDGADFRDIRAMPDGEQLIREAIENAQEWKPEADPDYRPGKPEIKVGPDEMRMTDAAIAALADRPDLYQRGGMLVEVKEAAKSPPCIVRPDGGVRAVRIPNPRLRELIANSCQFMKLKKTAEGEEWAPTYVPQTLVNQFEVRGNWPGLQLLEGVVTSPQFLLDGSVLAAPGYDRKSGLFFATETIFAAIPELPTREDAIAAARRILEVVAEFPITDVDKSAWLSAALTCAARHAIDGCTPLFAFDANVRGSGKTKLADSIGMIHTGRMLPRSSVSADNEENRKAITATLLAGEPITLWDNVAVTLGGPAIDALLTATTWTDRILGQSSMTAALPNRTVVFATGNNMVFGADTARRTLRGRLRSPLENPEERTNFRHPDLLGWVKQARGQLAADAVTILRAWHVAKRPEMGLPAWGSFEAWSDLIRNPIVWMGLPDPGATRQEVKKESDREAALLRQLLDAWAHADPHGHGLTVTDAITLSEKGSEPALTNAIAELTGPSGKPSSRSIGMKLHHLRGRVCGGRYFDNRDSNRGSVWIARKSSEDGESVLSDTKATSDTNPSLPTRVTTELHTSPVIGMCNEYSVIGDGAADSVTSPFSVTSCDHDLAAGLERGNELHCRACDKLLGYLDEVR